MSEDSSNITSGWQMLPYATALLHAYAATQATQPGHFRFGAEVHTRMPIAEATRTVAGSDVVGFSIYIWNVRLSLAIAQQLKKEHPETLIVFGGPQVPDQAEDFLRSNPFIDLVVHGEGERTFLEVLEQYPSRDWKEIGGISYLDSEGAFVQCPQVQRMKDLSVLPPVYSGDYFESLMNRFPGTQWAALLETNRGCPFACSFCDWGSATNSKVSRMEIEQVFAEIEWMGRNKIEYVFCCDANFGMLPRDEEIAKHVCDVRERYGYPKVFATQNTKNSTERSYRVQKLLHEAGVNSGVTLSFQSLDLQTLENVKRANISLDSFSELQRRYTRDQISTYTDMILALPGESLDSFVRGIGEIVSQGQHNNLFFYNCSILPNAEMADSNYRKQFGISTVVQEIVPIHAELDDIDGQEVREYLETVVSTDAMPPAEWVSAKMIWWLADLVYFGRLLQIPLVVLQETAGIRVGEVLLALSRADRDRFPTVGEVLNLFEAKAREIQSGGWEYFRAPEWLNLAWPANQYALAQLVTSGKLPAFYAEAREVLSEFIEAETGQSASFVFLEAVDFNQQLVRVPNVTNNLRITLSHNIWEFYQGVLTGEAVELVRKPAHYGVWRTRPTLVALDDWLEFIVHCQNVKFSYVYPVVRLDDEAKNEEVHSVTEEV